MTRFTSSRFGLSLREPAVYNCPRELLARACSAVHMTIMISAARAMKIRQWEKMLIKVLSLGYIYMVKSYPERRENAQRDEKQLKSRDLWVSDRPDRTVCVYTFGIAQLLLQVETSYRVLPYIYTRLGFPLKINNHVLFN